MTINERFALILKTKNISIKEASSILGKSEIYIRKLIRTGESFGIEPVITILNSITDINPDWLLSEKGDMFRTHAVVNPDQEERIRLISIIESQQRTIEILSKKD